MTTWGLCQKGKVKHSNMNQCMYFSRLTTTKHNYLNRSRKIVDRIQHRQLKKNSQQTKNRNFLNMM